MKRLAVEKICGFLLVLTISIPASFVNGQYYDNGQAGVSATRGGKLPLNQLPPIISSNQAQQNSTMLQPVKGLYIPSNVGNLPPIVSPTTQSSATTPFVYEQSNLPAIDETPQNQPRGIVPLYRGETPIGQTPKINSQQFGQSSFQGSGNRNAPAFQNSGSGTRSLPPVVSPFESNAPSLPTTQDFSSSLAPGDLPATPEVELTAPGSVVETGPINTPGSNNFFEQPQSVPGNQYIGNAGCSSCGQSGCYDPAAVQSQMGCCGSVVNAGYYVFADVLFWTREDGDVQLSNFFGLNDFNFVGGARITIGHRENATSGRELTYFGTGDLDEAETRLSTTGGLTALFAPTGGITNAQVSGFGIGFGNGAVRQTQTKETQLHSLEYNRIKWGWDVVKSFYGVRYVYFDDSYSLFSTNVAATNGLFIQDSVNNLFGVHGGWELFYDVGYRTSASINTKFGGYINSANVDTNLFNAGAQILGQETDDSAFASTVELGFLSHFQLSPRSRFRLGYDLFLMWGAFTVQNNIPRATFASDQQTGAPVLSPNTGTDLNTNNEAVFFHGLSFGFEVFR